MCQKTKILSLFKEKKFKSVKFSNCDKFLARKMRQYYDVLHCTLTPSSFNGKMYSLETFIDLPAIVCKT